MAARSLLTSADRIGAELYLKYLLLQGDPTWKDLAAVKNNAVRRIPSYPFGWSTPPASILGVRWVASQLYPELFPYSMRDETRKFYALFYGKN